MKIMKSLVMVVVVVVLLITPIMRQNEIVINNLTISWNKGEHFSIENEEDGMIKDAFIISKNHHNIDGFQWDTLNIEGWKNEDEHWFNFTMGL